MWKILCFKGKYMFKIISHLFILMLFSSYATAIDLTNGLVAHYEFEGNANDSSGNGNHGTEYL
jgi:hypothetical protein